MCYSEALDIIAFAGVSGKIYVMDQETKMKKTFRDKNLYVQAHQNEIVMLKFYDQQHQLISISNIGDVGLWDA